MERGPIPRHERTWRHPSELAAEEREALRAQAAAPSTRVFALTTGTLGLLAVGVLILTVTPRRQESPIAIIATTSPAAAAVAEGSSSGSGVADSRVSALAPAFGARGSLGPARAIEPVALATPIGDGRLVVVTRAALDDDLSDDVDVVLPSGRAAVGHVVHRTADALVLAIDDPPALGHAIANHRPHDREMVTVMASPPITVAYGDIDELSVDEGTAVFDDDGSLVGLCSRSGRGVRLIEISEATAAATTVER